MQAAIGGSGSPCSCSSRVQQPQRQLRWRRTPTARAASASSGGAREKPLLEADVVIHGAGRRAVVAWSR